MFDGALCRYAHVGPSLPVFAPCIQLLIELPDGNTELLTVSLPLHYIGPVTEPCTATAHPLDTVPNTS